MRKICISQKSNICYKRNWCDTHTHIINNLQNSCPYKCKTPHKISVLDMTPNYIQWSGPSSEALSSMQYPFVAITPKLRVTQSGSTCLGHIYGQIGLFEIISIEEEYLIPHKCMQANYYRQEKKKKKKKKCN